MLRLIIKYFDKYYLKLLSNDYDYIRKLWFSNTDIIGKNVRLVGEDSQVEGVINNIDDTGALILETKGKKIRILSGDLFYI